MNAQRIKTGSAGLEPAGPAGRWVGSAPQATPDRRGFSIIEMLVVISIIVLLISILIPTLSYTKKMAKKSATSARMAAIQSGLNQYFVDMQMYPESGRFGSRGPAALAEGLLGYLDTSSPAGGDGADGMGFRLRTGGNGRIYGPYAPFDAKILKVTSTSDMSFLDGFGNEIYYYRSTQTPNAAMPTTVTQVFGTSSNAVFVEADNPNSASSGTLKFFAMLGASGNSLSSGGGVLGRDSYLLVSAGVNGGGPTLPNNGYFDDDDVVSGR